MEKILRIWFAAFGVFALILTAGFLIDDPRATQLFPFEMKPLSRMFIASILAAIACPVIGVAISGEMAATAARAINRFVTSCGLTAYALVWAYSSPQSGPQLWFAAGTAFSAIVMVGLYRWASQLEFNDRRPLPWPILVAFAFISALLVYVGGTLVLVRPEIFPWQLSPELSVIFGRIFLGALCYFLHVLVYRVWGNVKGQLLGFLAYDLVLIVPFIQHFGKAVEPVLLNHIIYTSVVVFSGLLSIYYIFVSRDAWPFVRVDTQ